MAEKHTTEIVEKPKQTFSMALTESLDEVADALPKDFNMTRFVQNSVALLNDNETLANYARQYGTSQIKLGMMKAAYLGLDFMSKEAYLIPYGKTLNFMLDYRGNTKLIRKYSIRPVKDIYAKVVREGDEFVEKITDGHPSIDFRPKAFNNGKIIGAFAVCLFEDGGMIYDVMNLDELERTRKASKMPNGGAWKFVEEMYKKTILHRMCKHIQIDFDNPKQMEYFNEDNQADFGNVNPPKKASLNDVLSDDDVIDVDANSEVID